MQLIDILKRRSDNNKTALIFGQDNISYKELYNTIIHKESLLKQHNIYGSSKTIGIFIPNSIDYVVAYFTLALSNKVIVPIDIRNKKEELINIIKYCDLNVIITNTYYSKYLKDYLQDKEIDILIYDIDNENHYAINNRHEDNYDSVKIAEDGSKESYCDSKQNEDELKDVALMLRTSGSLSKPKRVMLTSDNLITSAESIISHLGLTENDIALVALPLYLASGNTSQMLTHLYLGATLVIMDAMFTAEYCFSLIDKYRITDFTCVPYMLYKLNEYNNVQYDISSIRFICFGGAPTPVDIIRQVDEKYKDISFIQMYGQTEVATRISHLLPDYMPSKIGSVGQAIPNMEIKLVNESRDQIAVGEVGEVLVRGKTVMKGYYKREHETREALVDGWLHTGDLGKVDKDNFLYIVGRKKNILIKGGTNIFPEEIEEVLQSHPAVKEVLVYPINDEQLGELPVAKIVLHEDMTQHLHPVDLKRYCLKKLSSYKVPERIEIVNKLEKTASGKIARRCSNLNNV